MPFSSSGTSALFKKELSIILYDYEIEIFYGIQYNQSVKKQLQLDLYKGSHGGRRPGSGRKRIHSKGVAHRVREKITSRTPVHINFKYKLTVRSMKSLRILERAIENAKSFSLNVTHFSLQSNHIHLIAEAPNNRSLESGMRSLTNTLAKRFGKGSIQLERYHLHVLRCPSEAKNAVKYVLSNDRKHGHIKDVNFTRCLGTGRCWYLNDYFFIKRYCF